MGAATAVGLGTSIYQMYEGKQRENEGQKNIDAFEFSDRPNPYTNQTVSTIGSDYKVDQLNTDLATNTEALREGGTRALIGGLGRQTAASNKIMQGISSDLDLQQKAIDRDVAGYEEKKNAMQENRELQEISGYGQLLNKGIDTTGAGAKNLLGTAGLVQGSEWGKSADAWMGDLFKDSGDSNPYGKLGKLTGDASNIKGLLS